ncbi:AAA family ATPase, partial [Streptomyces vulcanius]
MRLIERDDHQALIRSLIRDSLAGRGQVLLLEGVAAGGRTALLAETVAQAERAGLLTLRVACSPLESELTGSVLSQLVHGLPDPGELAEAAVPDYHAFCRAVLRAAARTPLVIAVDDVHHADAASVQGLLYLARRLGTARVLLVAASRRDDGGFAEDFATALLSDPRVHRLDVAPLSAAGTARLVAERLGEVPDEAGLTAEFHRLSGGSPALLKALVDDWRHGGTVTEQGYGGAVVDLLRRWDAGVLRIARALAVLGEHGTPDRVAALAGLDRDSGAGAVERTLAVLTSAGVLHGGRFPHPVAAAAVAGTVAGAERAALNRRAAQLLHALGESAPAVARHLAESRQRVEAWAVPVLAEAAEQEVLAGYGDRAARYFELAHEACPDPAGRAVLLDQLAEAEWRLNPSAALRRLPALVAAAQTGLLSPERLPGLVRRLLWHGRQADAETVLARLREATAADPALQAETRGLDSWLRFTYPGLARHGSALTPTRGTPGPAPAAEPGARPWPGPPARLTPGPPTTTEPTFHPTEPPTPTHPTEPPTPT